MQVQSALKSTIQGFKKNIPIIIGVMLLISLVNTVVPKEFYTKVLNINTIIDPIVGSLIGSIAAGNPINSYIIGNELLENGVGLLPVTAFIISWVTVGVLTFPAESYMLGRRFALVRNLTSFVLAIVMALITVFILGML